MRILPNGNYERLVLIQLKSEGFGGCEDMNYDLETFLSESPGSWELAYLGW